MHTWPALSVLHELKEHLSLSAIKKFQASRCRPGLSLQQAVLHSGCLLQHQYSSAAPLGGLDTSEVSLAQSSLQSMTGQVHSMENVQGGVASLTAFLAVFTTAAASKHLSYLQ